MNNHKTTTLENFQRPTGKVVLVGGCFDIIHIGHVIFLENAKTRGEKLVIALESDEFIQERKKRKPFHTEEERARILSALSCVDVVVVLPFLKSDHDYENLVQKISPDIIAVTEGDPYSSQKMMYAENVGGNIAIISEFIQDKSTTNILNFRENANKNE